MTGQGAIYIGGLSYSGKTQLRLMLMAQPGILITRRTYMWPRYYGRFGDLGQDENLARCLDAMLAAPGIRALEPDRVSIERDFRAGPPTYARLFALFHAHDARRRGARRWGDQLGGIEQYATPLLEGDPAARMIHLVRDPRARLAVILRTGRRPGIAGWETQQWQQSARLALSHCRAYPGRYRLVRYEELRGDTARVLAEVWAFLGETAPRVAVPDASLWGGDPQPAPGRRVVAYVERQAAAEMTALGYALCRPMLGARERARLALIDAPLNGIGIVARRGFRRKQGAVE